MSTETVRWRAGTKVHRTIYVHEGGDPRGQIVGLMDTPELAALVVDAVNAHLARQRETPETAMRPEDVPAELVEIAEQACGQESLSRFILAAVLPAHEAMVRAKVAEEFRAAAQAIEDSRGEDEDPLAGEIWDTCERSREHPATLEDPRTIATVAYRHLAHKAARGDLP